LHYTQHTAELDRLSQLGLVATFVYFWFYWLPGFWLP